jgi:hypothetical protein
MSLTLQRRNIDSGDAGYWHIVKFQVSDQSDFARPIAVVLNGPKITAASIERDYEFGASPRVSKLDRDITELNSLLQSVARFFAHARFHRMLTFAEKFD